MHLQTSVSTVWFVCAVSKLEWVIRALSSVYLEDRARKRMRDPGNMQLLGHEIDAGFLLGLSISIASAVIGLFLLVSENRRLSNLRRQDAEEERRKVLDARHANANGKLESAAEIENNPDVIIVGAGVAGAALACSLGKVSVSSVPLSPFLYRNLVCAVRQVGTANQLRGLDCASMHLAYCGVSYMRRIK